MLELRSTELERRLEEATAERDALLARESEADERRGALTAALASAAEPRSPLARVAAADANQRGRARRDAVRLAVLEAEKATTAPALRAALDEAEAEAVPPVRRWARPTGGSARHAPPGIVAARSSRPS